MIRQRQVFTDSAVYYHRTAGEFAVDAAAPFSGRIVVDRAVGNRRVAGEKADNTSS